MYETYPKQIMNKTKLRHNSIWQIEKSNSQKTKSSSWKSYNFPLFIYVSKLSSRKSLGSNYLKLPFSNNTHNTQIWQFTKYNFSDPRFPWNEAIHGFHFSFKAENHRIRNDGMFSQSRRYRAWMRMQRHQVQSIENKLPARSFERHSRDLYRKGKEVKDDIK